MNRKSKWNKYLKGLETEIKDLSLQHLQTQKRHRGLKRLMNGKNYSLVERDKQNVLKIRWNNKVREFHIPRNKTTKKSSKSDIDKVVQSFINDIVNGKM